MFIMQRTAKKFPRRNILPMVLMFNDQLSHHLPEMPYNRLCMFQSRRDKPAR